MLWLCRNESEFLCLSLFVSNLDVEPGKKCTMYGGIRYFFALEDDELFESRLEKEDMSVGKHIFFLICLQPTTFPLDLLLDGMILYHHLSNINSISYPRCATMYHNHASYSYHGSPPPPACVML